MAKLKRKTEAATAPPERWYAVHTEARAEWLAAQELERRGYKVIYLYRWGEARHARRTDIVKKPLFPRYLFVGLTGRQSLWGVNSCHGVSTVLYQAGDALEVQGEDLRRLLEWGDEDGCVGHEPTKAMRERFKRGQRVRLLDGPFAGYDGTVSVDRGRTVSVSLVIFARAVPAEIDPEDLHPLHPDCRAIAKSDEFEPAFARAF